MEKSNQLYKNNKVWLSSTGCVVGFDVDELNEYITYYNNRIYPCDCFFDWLSYELNEEYYGFNSLWNYKNPLLNKIIKIKGDKKQ